VEQEAVDDLEGALLDVLVGAVHRVPGLEADDALPAPLPEGGPRLGRIQAVGPEIGVPGAVEHGHRAAHEGVPAPVERGHARMGLLGRPVDLLRLLLLLVREDVLDVKDGQHRPLPVPQRHIVSRLDPLLELFAERQGDRDGPGLPPRQRQVAHDAGVVGAGHEAPQGAKASARDQLEIGDLPRPEGDRGEGPGPAEPLLLLTGDASRLTSVPP
jgi:hypothetical protein